MDLSWDLGYVFEAARKVSQHEAKIRVKGDDYVLSVLRKTMPVTELLGKRYENIKKISWEINKWIDVLDKAYKIDSKNENEVFLNIDDAIKLEEVSGKWFTTIKQEFIEPSTDLIDLEKLNKEVFSLSKKTGRIAKDDLLDAYLCIGNAIPTPAVMIMNRVGEHMVRKFYKKIMKKDPPANSNWWDLEKELRTKLGEKDHLVGLLQYRRGKRNTAQHPGERYTQKQSELVFFQIQELIEEIYRRLNKKSS